MGSNAHKPGHTKAPSEFSTGHAHDEMERASAPGTRRGVPSRILAARERHAHDAKSDLK
ncbi:MAG: hypothetical protein WDA16_05595 [Candidatus Thermoplasmatota archaeon]